MRNNPRKLEWGLGGCEREKGKSVPKDVRELVTTTGHQGSKWRRGWRRSPEVPGIDSCLVSFWARTVCLSCPGRDSD